MRCVSDLNFSGISASTLCSNDTPAEETEQALRLASTSAGRSGCTGRSAEEGLNGSDVGARLEQLCRERVPKCVAACFLGDIGVAHGFSDGSLKDGLMQVVAVAQPRLALAGHGNLCKQNPKRSTVRSITRIWERGCTEASAASPAAGG